MHVITAGCGVFVGVHMPAVCSDDIHPWSWNRVGFLGEYESVVEYHGNISRTSFRISVNLSFILFNTFVIYT